MLSRNILLYGTPEAPAPLQKLEAGPLNLFFQNGDLRSITCAGREVLRRVYAAVRDANWGTIPARISGLKIDARPKRFLIRYQADHQSDPIHFRWQARIEGTPSGEITFSMLGEALTTFRRNRIGFCVHHPLEGFAGRDCAVETADGWQPGRVPSLVAPHQPFLGLRAIRHTISPGCQAEVRFHGEIFEMEDHRNWTDANFKTYGTPLSLPFPVEVPAGTRIEQSVTLRLIGPPPRAAQASTRSAVSIAVPPASQPQPLPELGIATASLPWQPNPEQIRRLAALKLSYLRVDAASLAAPPPELAALRLPLEVSILLGEDPQAQLTRLAAQLRQLPSPVRRWVVYDEKAPVTSARSLQLARSLLPGGILTGGTRANFAELNRNRPDPRSLDAVCFALNPQVHAFDHLSLAENCAAQGDVIRSARAFCGSLPLYVSPVTLRQQFNPVATGAEAPPPPGVLPSQVDPRQMSLFGAAWTLASFKYLAEAGAAGVTYYESAGWKGILESSAGSPLPDKFPSLPGSVFPLWHLLADLGDFRGGQVLPCTSSHPLAVECLLLQSGSRRRLLLANLSTEPQHVELPASLLAPSPRLRLLDAASAEKAMQQPESFREPTALPAATTASASPQVSRRALLGSGLAALSSSRGRLRLSLDACALACLE